ETMISRIHDETDPAAIVRIGKGSFFVDRMTGCREAHWRGVGDGRAGGAVGSAVHALSNLWLDDYLVGEWEEAQELADEWPAVWTVLWRVDAAVRTNRHAEALAHGDVMRGAAVAALSPRLALVSLGSAAIARGDSDDIALFEQALAILGAGRWPFDVARVQLA